LNIRRFKGIFAALFLFFAGSFLYAQSTAQEVEALLANDEVNYADAARFILRASEQYITSDAEEAFWYAAKKGWLPDYTEPSDPARIDGVGLLIMNAFDIEGGFFYSVTKSPHYAFRELEYRGIIQGRADRYMKISGELLIFIVSRTLAVKEAEEERAAKFAEERPTLDKKKDYLQPESFDFGLLLFQDAAFYHDYTFGTTDFIYKASAAPRISFLLGDNGFFITSMGITVEKSDEFYKIFEVLRTELSLRFGAVEIRGGRFNYADPMSFALDSLYDGIMISHSSGAGQFNIGSWYTGVLYKKNANILMTQNDRDIYNAPLIKGDFLSSYFAPPRIIISMDWNHPSISEFIQLNTALSAQFDMSHKVERLHSQYFTFRAATNFKKFLVIGGGSIEASEIKGANEAIRLGIAGELGFYIPLHFKIDGQLSLKARYGSGNTGKPFYAFTPVTTSYYGEIFKLGISGHTMLDVTYSARLFKTVGASFTVSYFIRNDLKTPNSYIITGTDMGNKLLGTEIFSKVVWSPFSDMQLNLGVGAFIPPFGNNWPDRRSIWKVNLTTLIALY